MKKALVFIVLLFIGQLSWSLPIQNPALQKNKFDFSNYVSNYKNPQFFADNEIALKARLKLLDQVPAGGRVKILTFIFENGYAARLLAAHMCLAARRGVQVQFMADSKTGDRPGRPDAFDLGFDHQVNEEIYQTLANCGVEVRIHNHIPRYEDILSAGMRIPYINEAKMGVSHRIADFVHSDLGTYTALSELISQLKGVFTEEAEKFNEKEKVLLNELKKGFFKLLENSIASYAKNRTELSRYESLVAVMSEVQKKIVQSKLVKRLSPTTVKFYLHNILDKVQTRGVLSDFYREARLFNRLNHRKLFWVEYQGQSCFLMGGRNLGDHYLTWGRKKDEFMDGDVLICNHHLSSRDENVILQAQNSFDELWLNRDLEDPLNVKPLVTIVKPQYNFKFQYLIFPDRNGVFGWGNPMWIYMPYIASQNRWVMINYEEARLRPLSREQHQERQMPAPLVWSNTNSFMGESLVGGFNWRVRTSTWNTKKDAVRAELYAAIDNEKELIYIETAYSEFSTTFKEHIESALNRGVPVHIVTNSIYVSDAGSKAIRLVMARWTRQMLEKFPSLFRVEFATVGYGHMIHFKGANFSCQQRNGEAFRLNLVGSHNFHGRSGYSDKEHAIIWQQKPKASCLKRLGLDASLASNDADLREIRGQFYQKLTQASANNQPLKAFKTFAEEIQDGLSSGKLSESRKKISKLLLNALYQQEVDPVTKQIRIKKVAGRAVLKVHDEFLGFLELLSESGVSDIVGALL